MTSFEIRWSSRSVRLAPYRPSLSRPLRSRQLIDEGSGGTSPMIGLIALAARAITREYSS